MAGRRTIADAPRYSGPATRHVAMPLGGIGTGTVALAGDGSLRQWQLHNTGNHEGFIPDTFFVLRVTQGEPPRNDLRLIQAVAPPQPEPTPLVTDDAVPPAQQKLRRLVPTMSGCSFQAIYPFARIRFHDDDLPVAVEMEAFTPLVPRQVADSALPAALFTLTITNRGAYPVSTFLGATLQNAIGWDGITPIDGVSCPLYGGNTNRLMREAGWALLVAENLGLPADHPGAGQMVLGVDDENAAASLAWDHPDQFIRFLRGRAAREVLDPTRHPRAARIDPQPSGPVQGYGPSPAGRTWDAGLCTTANLEPGDHVTVRCVLAWHFPNRYVNFDQFGPQRDYGHSRFWLGNAYARRHPDALHVASEVRRRWAELRTTSLAWTNTLLDSSLSPRTVERLAAQAVVPRSPTCFQDAEGRFFGFEGVLGASTTMWSGDHGGSCPLNCTHVWNYEQAMSRMFPTLARDMRETEFDVMQAPEGYLPHRVLAPVYLRQLWDVPIGGPEQPALDGMLGAVLKTYREVRLGAGGEWLSRYWPQVRRLLDYVRRTWDPDGGGVLRGIQPSTHDIDLCGVNSFMGTYWLAALRAAETMARAVGESSYADELRVLFEKGSSEYDALLFNGEYYVQRLGPGDDHRYQWGAGCLSDQLIGQWWAHQLDLGHLLPVDHVREALRAVVRYNFRDSFRGLRHDQRVYADGDDRGLVMCTWPAGGRPATAVRYADEVWSGVEYQVAAHCVMEGLVDEGTRILDALWGRHDGTRRNPFNEIECGDHYARSLSGWSVLEAVNGLRYDPDDQVLSIVAPGDLGGRYPFLVGGAWGTVDTRDGRLHLYVRGGALTVNAVRYAALAHGDTATLRDGAGGFEVGTDPLPDGVRFLRPVRLSTGQTLDIAPQDDKQQIGLTPEADEMIKDIATN